MNQIGILCAASAFAVCLAGCTNMGAGEEMSAKKSSCKVPSFTVKPFGKTSQGQAVKMIELKGAGGVVMDVLDYGGKVNRLFTPDRSGKLADITTGYNDVQGYEKGERYFGSLIGRYGNRIAHGKFALDGQTYTLPLNDHPGDIPCSLHGGTGGFDSRIWEAEPFVEGKTVGIRFALTSPDGDQGYPGTLKMKVTYRLTADNVWRIEYEATTDKATPVNLTQHTFFNLKGEGRGSILDHELTIFADAITPVDKGLIPTGKMMPVAGTPFDFTTPHLIGERIDADNEQIKHGPGYDHNWVLRDHPADQLFHAATLSEATSGRKMEIWTMEPCMQFYAGNFMTEKEIGKQGQHLCFRGALALETQHAPDSPNQSTFPSTILRPGAVYKTVTEYRFGTK